jgi:hypothetical protein
MIPVCGRKALVWIKLFVKLRVNVMGLKGDHRFESIRMGGEPTIMR